MKKTIFKNEADDMFGVRHITSFNDEHVKCIDRYKPNLKARLAIGLVERWGMICSEHHPRNMDGQQRVYPTLMTPADVVHRAVTTVEELYSAIEARGWLLEVPAPTPDEEEGTSHE